MLFKVDADLIRLSNIPCSEEPRISFPLKLILFKLEQWPSILDNFFAFALFKLILPRPMTSKEDADLMRPVNIP